jgi:hypothetical protein
LAAERGDEKMVRLLLEKGARVEGETELRQVAWNGHEAALRLLLGHIGVVQLLLEMGATPRNVDVERITFKGETVAFGVHSGSADDEGVV